MKPVVFPPQRVGVVADDLTGAGDVGMAFLALDPRVEIGLWDGKNFPKKPRPGTRVWILDTESRHLSPRQAASRVRKAVQILAAWHADFFFKKIDSTLRGPIGAELQAFLSGLTAVYKNNKLGPLSVVPAFPKAKRYVRQGQLFVGDVPLAQTSFAKDPCYPVVSSDVKEIVQRTWPGAGALTEIPHVAQQKDLMALARQWLSGVDPLVFAAGSGGLAAALASVWQSDFQPKKKKMVSVLKKKSMQKMVVAGSAHPVTHQQLAWLKKQTPSVAVLESPKQSQNPKKILRDITKKALILAHQKRVRGFVVTGGDTAAALAQALGHHRWQVCQGLEPGVTLCRSISPVAFSFVLKPGGFGQRDTLQKCWEALNYF